MAEEELNEEQEVESVEEGDDSLEEEESTEQTDDTLQSEESSEESEEDKPEETKSEYTKERHDGLMSQWQEDRRARLELEKEKTQWQSTQSQKQEKNQEEKWFDYIANKMEQRNATKRQTEDETAKRELSEVMLDNPKLKKEELLNTAIKYGVNLHIAADVLKDIRSSRETGKKLTEGEIKRKKLAGKIGGKPGVTQKSGLTAYDPKLSFEENFQKGIEESGM